MIDGFPTLLTIVLAAHCDGGEVVIDWGKDGPATLDLDAFAAQPTRGRSPRR